MIMKIIPFEEKYRNDAERICVDTGDKDNMINPEHRRFSVLMYCDEYIKYETVIFWSMTKIGQLATLCALRIIRVLKNI
jgi:hypothetical protein